MASGSAGGDAKAAPKTTKSYKIKSSRNAKEIQMRKISKLAARAFINERKFSRDNTSVRSFPTIDGKMTELYLHGNVIARKRGGKIHLSLAGWPTMTTRERLNTLLNELNKSIRFYQHKHEQFASYEFFGSQFPKYDQPINSRSWYLLKDTGLSELNPY